MSGTSSRDHALGLDRKITRRDFLDGALLTAGALSTAALGRPTRAETASYPPGLTGLRGQTPQSFAIMHALRDGIFWDKAGVPQATGEAYDLVAVGGGISGLAAAFLYRQQAGTKARVLILENNDDFGGHARRNEFTASNGRKIIGYGGSQSLQTPSYFSPAVKQLLRDIAIDTDKFKSYYDQDWADKYKLGPAVLFTREAFGIDRLVKLTGMAADWVPKTPLNDRAKRDLIELIDQPRDYLPGKSREEKLEILSRTTYAKFLTEVCSYDPQLVTYFQNATEGYFGVGIDGITALDAWGDWEPGFDGMDLGNEAHRAMSASARRSLTDPDSYIFHFPDGNAGVARSLVRAMIPAALPGHGMESLVAAVADDYSKLDVEGCPVRLRLTASVVKVAHDGTPSRAKSVTVTYMENGTLKTVAAGHVVLACWHRVIPYLTNELALEQIEALNDQQKVPLVLANVLIRNWEALAKLGIRGFKAPSSSWHGAALDFPVSMGDYRFAATPSDPVLLSLVKVPLGAKGSPAREQSLAGRRALIGLTFEDMEREIRDMLGRALSEGGFDPAHDIEAITINRWAHGYAREYLRPWDAFWPDGKLPIETARKPWGRIAVANADSGAYAYANCAIDQAARAVRDLLGDSAHLPAFADFPGPPRDMIGLK